MGNHLAQTESVMGTREFTADQVLSPYIYVFMAAYLVAFCFTPVMRSVAASYGIIDRPDGVRKMHQSPVAYLGGVAVFLGWLVGLAVSQFLPLHRTEEGLNPRLVINFGIVLAACMVVVLGLWDDILRATPRTKVLVQALAAFALWWSGVGRRAAWPFIAPVLNKTITHLGWPNLTDAQIVQFQQGWVVQGLSLLFVVGVVVLCCNAANLLDGLDGLCGGVTAVVSGGYLFLAVHLAMHSGALNANLDALRVVISLALLGGVLGFVPFNFNPASIFMGDTGSMFLGFCCALMMILFASSGDPTQFKWFLGSMVMFSLPLLDTALAFTRRWVNRRPLFSPDRFHLHHQLVARGFSVKQTVVISYGLSLVFAVLGALIVYARTRYAVAIYLVVFGSLVVAAVKMGMVHERVRAVVRRPLGSGAATDDEEEPLKAEQVSPAAVLEVRERRPAAAASPSPSAEVAEGAANASASAPQASSSSGEGWVDATKLPTAASPAPTTPAPR